MTDEDIQLALENCEIIIREKNNFSLACEVNLEVKDGIVTKCCGKGLPRKQGDEWYNWCKKLEKVDAQILNRILSYNKKNNVVVYVEYRKPVIGHIWQDTESKDTFVFIDWIGGSEDFVAFSYKHKTIRLIDRRMPMPRRYKFIGESVVNFFNMFQVKKIKE